MNNIADTIAAKKNVAVVGCLLISLTFIALMPFQEACNARLIYQALPVVASGYLVGVAVFNLDGLLNNSFTIHESCNGAWIQTILQVLGIQLLFNQMLPLGACQRITVHSAQGRLVISQQDNYYLGLWIQAFDDTWSYPPHYRAA